MSAAATWQRLFLTRMEAVALGVLLVAEYGWNLSVIDRAEVPRASPDQGEDGHPTYRIPLEKPRRGAGRHYETRNVTDDGAASPGRLITQALEATRFARALVEEAAPGTSRLIVWRTGRAGRQRAADQDGHPPVGLFHFGVHSDAANEWAKAEGLDGSPFQRGRRTVIALDRREPGQHSQDTHDRHYVLPDKRVQAGAVEVIAAGAEDAADRARRAVLAAQLRDQPVRGDAETATADCSGYHDSPYPSPDGGCGASFLTCLACPNARVHPGHHPRLAHLHEALASLRSVLPPAAWAADWRDAHDRLEDLRQRLGDGPWAQGLARVTGRRPRARQSPADRDPRRMTAAPDLDPYLLPLPAPASPVVLPHLATSLHAHLNGRYADPVWPLAPLTENPSASKKAIRWAQWPASFQDEMRLAAWNLINGQLRPTFLQGHGSRMRSRLSLSDIYNTAGQWKQLARWLEERGIRSLAECSASVLHDYGQHLRDTSRSRGPVLKILVSLTRLWAFDQLSARPNGIGRPPWDELGVDDYLPAATTVGGENATEPLAEQTMGPLLIWAMRMVDDLSADILAGWAERQRLAGAARASTATPAGLAALEAYLRPLIGGQAPLPATVSQRQACGRPHLHGRHHRRVPRPGRPGHHRARDWRPQRHSAPGRARWTSR